MSFDKQIDQVCPHMVVEEALFVDTDRLTVRPKRPIAAVASVSVRFNGLADVPSDGILTTARVVSSEGPFDVDPSTNTLIIQVGSGSSATIQIPSAQGLSADRLAKALNGYPWVHFSSEGRRLVMETAVGGEQATMKLLPGSTMASVLGYPVNRVWSGKTTVPGWYVVADPRTLADRPTRLIVFDSPLPGFSDFVEINYSTIRQECRRCGGLGVEHDWRYSRRGDVVAVRDEALLIQENLKMVFTILGSNPFHGWYGSSLVDMLARKITMGRLIHNVITTDISDAFRRWQSIKKQQEEVIGQDVTDREFPYRLVSVEVQESDQDPTVVYVSVTIQNRSGDPIQITRGLQVPVGILDQSAAQGVFRQSLDQYTLTA